MIKKLRESDQVTMYSFMSRNIDSMICNDEDSDVPKYIKVRLTFGK